MHVVQDETAIRSTFDRVAKQPWSQGDPLDRVLPERDTSGCDDH